MITTPDVLTSADGDGGRYPCPRCPAELPLAELIDHLTIHLEVR